MIERDPIGNDGRVRYRMTRLGPNPACARCGYLDPAALVPGNTTTLEEHHPGGQRNDPKLKVTLCRNCHSILTELNLKHGVSMKEPSNDLELVQNCMRGLGVFLSDAGDRLDEWSTLVERHWKDSENGRQEPKGRPSGVHDKKQKETKTTKRKRASRVRRSKAK